MKEIRQEINFNDPILATEVFRLADNSTGKTSEHGIEIAFGWEDVKMIESYPYPDNWEAYKGEKYYLTLQGHPTQKLIWGKRQTMIDLWTLFRNTYPIFRDTPDEDQSEE